ncbi:hypothetical protein [Pseudomonas reidholzensis]|uniref:hypothetical protein n=1 Tax=Pseudomonas reidholzensis TaxID=1785162 RepID=UPI0011C49B69|nr:hypothetical protein [Pseudomonas reidholzensis]
MENNKSKGGRPKKENPRTVVSEVYLTPAEAEELRAAGKKFGFAYLSQFLRTAAFALIKQKSIGLDSRSSLLASHLGAIMSDINLLHDISSRPGMPETAFLISGSVQDKIRRLNNLIQKQ